MLEEIQKLGASLIALSPEIPKAAQTTAEKNGLTFHILSDEGNRVARKLGIVFKLSDELRAFYQSIGIDLTTHNGDPTWELPLPATYLIGPDGIIRDRFINTDYVKRMEPADILKSLQAIQ